LWTVGACVYGVMYVGRPVGLVEIWHVAVQPAVSCQVEVAWPGLWQSQHFWAPRAVKPLWHRVHVTLVGAAPAWQPAAQEPSEPAVECFQPL
jgi:hypothetical protein